ncbi:MAG: hypothetical protein JWO38_7720 [Gemmataceae bacterium]|nr:hypothetical protein [Gemmataceae bacterium]
MIMQRWVRSHLASWSMVLTFSPAPVNAEPPAAPADTRSVTDRIGELKPVPADPADGPVRKLQKESFNARLGAAKIQLAAVRAGAAARLDLTGLVDRLAVNGADLEDKPADRVKWFQLRVDALREQERMAKSRADVGGILQMDALLITAARADAEVDLLRLRDSLKEKK